jgi:GxxExxY protein
MEDEISNIIIGVAIEVHLALGGPGLLESVYEAALCHELTLQGLQVQRQVPLEIVYKGVKIKDPLYTERVSKIGFGLCQSLGIQRSQVT